MKHTITNSERLKAAYALANQDLNGFQRGQLKEYVKLGSRPANNLDEAQTMANSLAKIKLEIEIEMVIDPKETTKATGNIVQNQFIHDREQNVWYVFADKARYNYYRKELGCNAHKRGRFAAKKELPIECMPHYVLADPVFYHELDLVKDSLEICPLHNGLIPIML